MKRILKKKIKDRISSRIRKYLINRKITTYQVLDDIFPQEKVDWLAVQKVVQILVRKLAVI
jgi:hypothetical protein